MTQASAAISTSLRPARSLFHRFREVTKTICCLMAYCPFAPFAVDRALCMCSLLGLLTYAVSPACARRCFFSMVLSIAHLAYLFSCSPAYARRCGHASC